MITNTHPTDGCYSQLILNAGINANSYGLDADGIEGTFGVDWLGHYYALNLLHPLLRSISKLPGAPAPRIVFESSDLHRWAPKETKFNSIKYINNQKLSPVTLYGRTKLAMILAVKFCLARRVIARNGDQLYALRVHPAELSLNYCKATDKGLTRLLRRGKVKHPYARAVEGCVPRRH